MENSYINEIIWRLKHKDICQLWKISLTRGGAFTVWSVRQWAHVFEFLIVGMCVKYFLCVCDEEYLHH